MLRKFLLLAIQGEFAQLYYHLWLRLKRLDFSNASMVNKSDGQPYSNSGGPNLERVLRSLAIKKKGSVMLELGVGKGIACITLSKFFDAIIGVDLSQDLIDVARANLVRVNITNVKLYCENARTFCGGLDDVTHVYMFNPFSREVTKGVFENIKRSVERRPRTITLIYLAPYAHELCLDAGFKHRRDFAFGKDNSVQNRCSIYDILPGP